MNDAMPWTAEQQNWLAALGHTVWVRGALPEAEVAPPPADVPKETPAPALPPSRREFQPKAPRPPQAGHSASRPAPALSDADGPAPVAVPRRAAVRLPDRLHIALIRAAGINPNSPEMADVVAQLPSSAELRGNPAAKRALWPRLRALRAKART